MRTIRAGPERGTTKLWERRWTEGTGSAIERYQGMYAIPLIEGGEPSVGVRITICVDGVYYERQSYATAEVFDGQQWHVVSGLPAALMRSGAVSVVGSGRARWSDPGAERDIRLLLSDCELAFAYRAPGSGEWARVQRRAAQPQQATDGDATRCGACDGLLDDEGNGALCGSCYARWQRHQDETP